ncbi:MAG TPA: response regulator transcription factor [Alphaproteobacteria bacterium]|nr:response regulator transcription factor [Alphaproteobacteria bacterium]
MSKIRILIVDDHAILRAGLRMLINAQPDMEVVSEATDGHEALSRARDMKPDVALMDITMPKTGGLQALEQLRQACPQTRILVLTMHDDPAYALSVLAAGGLGYVVKRAADSDLLAAIRAVYLGRTFVDSTLAGSLVQDLLGKHMSSGAADKASPRSLLSPRECEVLRLLAQGYTNQQAAKWLMVSVKTVETYRARIAQKLGLHSRPELTRYALESGLLTPESLISESGKLLS